MKKNVKSEPPGLSTEERAAKLLLLCEAKAKELGVSPEGIRPALQEPGSSHSELAIVACIAYVAGAITGGRLREELHEAFIRRPEEWQSVLDFACGMAIIQHKTTEEKR